MKKKILFFFLLTVLLPAFAGDSSVRTFFPSLSEKSPKILPVDSFLGQTASADETPTHKFLESILTSDFDYMWFFNNVEESVRSPLSSMYSDLLYNIIPSTHYFSKARTNGDGSTSVSVRFIYTEKEKTGKQGTETEFTKTEKEPDVDIDVDTDTDTETDSTGKTIKLPFTEKPANNFEENPKPEKSVIISFTVVENHIIAMSSRNII